MKTLDLRKKYKSLYRPAASKIELVEIPEFQFIMIDGRIEKGHSPETSPAFMVALPAIYGAAYTLKFMSKQRKSNPIDYPVMALEGLWWVEDGEFDISKPDNWCWRMMVMQPDHVTADMFEEALEKLRKKKPSAALEKLRWERYREGLCVQAMHIGPYSTEPDTIRQMQAFATEQGYTERHDRRIEKGKLTIYDHHEIYLSDPRRTKPEKLKTVLRHPVIKT